MKNILEQLGKEIDKDIVAFLSADSLSRDVYKENYYYKNWELIKDPILTMLEWQKLRDRKDK